MSTEPNSSRTFSLQNISSISWFIANMSKSKENSDQQHKIPYLHGKSRQKGVTCVNA